MKKINFTFLLAILMSMVVSSAFAYDAEVDGIYYNFSSGNATVTFYSSYSSGNANAYKGDIVIPESVTYNDKTYRVTSIGSSAFKGCSGLTSVNMPNSMTIVSSYAFEYCSGLTSITIPSGVTTIGNSAFYGCSNLTDVKVSVTDLSAFCNNKVIGLIASNIGKPVSLIDKDG
ncbi:leucine-rich repeat domain-containing protein, partial [Prevotella sp. tf2-5]|uniref:leucine-rich repeat domain-containing protein n=1 Tax=Prevotella sp. tf2-5 TaxID=1761889 RepID=UPI0008F05151